MMEKGVMESRLAGHERGDGKFVMMGLSAGEVVGGGDKQEAHSANGCPSNKYPSIEGNKKLASFKTKATSSSLFEFLGKEPDNLYSDALKRGAPTIKGMIEFNIDKFTLDPIQYILNDPDISKNGDVNNQHFLDGAIAATLIGHVLTYVCNDPQKSDQCKRDKLGIKKYKKGI